MKKLVLILSFFVSLLQVHAEEGMLIPSLIQAFESDMKAKGMKLTAADIYSVNQASLKDAIFHFGGGCTAELVSKEGLLLTNHHCGYSYIQAHSSLKNDYLKYGFWAKNKSEELANVGLTASRIVRIDDVTSEVLAGTNELTGDLRKKKIQSNISEVSKNKQGNGYRVQVREFDYGNSYYAMISEVFEDVRLVGTPPNSIGKFGGDTDNWVWPRHTGDFSVFRIYANKENKPAGYSADNVPYTPIKYLKVNAGKKTPGDFTMVYGFPGTTEQHHTSQYLSFIINKERPARIAMRAKSLSVIDQAMRASDEVRIQYSAKQASIANAYKKWIGQIDGLKNLDAVGIKQAFEKDFQAKVMSNPVWKDKYGTIVKDINDLVVAKSDYEFAYALFIEYIYTGPEFYKLVRNANDLIKNYDKYKEAGTLDKRIESNIASLDVYFKNYSAVVDRQIFELLHQEYIKYSPFALPSSVTKLSAKAWADKIYGASMFTSKEKMLTFYKGLNPKKAKTYAKDPAMTLYTQLFAAFEKDVMREYSVFNSTLESLLKVYSAAKKELFPEGKHWLDANSTLRVTYGLLEGSSPNDGMQYLPFTTTAGILQKWKTGNPDFEVLPGIIRKYENKEFGPYAQDGELWVCFTGSNHTTGGNSGSPVLDKNGSLIGLNFDRTWESTMSDYMFDPNRCRNITVDIRYVLWTMDIYGNAKHLVDEMELVYE